VNDQQSSKAAAAYEAAAGSKGDMPRTLCVVGGLVAIVAGCKLAMLEAASENSLVSATANGLGWYCIGRGIFMIGAPFHTRRDVD